MDEGEVVAPRRWPCVILLPNGEGHQKEAKVFPLAKAPTFDRLLAESSNRFAREITRIFVVLPEHQPHPAEGSAPVTELNSANYVDVCTRLPPRCVLYVSRGEPFHHNVRRPCTNSTRHQLMRYVVLHARPSVVQLCTGGGCAAANYAAAEG